MNEVLRILRAGGLPIWRPVLRIAATSLVGVLLETIAMLVAVQIFGVLFSDDSSAVSIAGINASIGAACSIGLGSMLLSALLQFEAGRLTSSLSTRYLGHLRAGLLDAVQEASSGAQLGLGVGRLQELTISIAYQASLLPMRAAAMVTSAIATAALIGAAFVVEPLAAIALVVSGLALTLAMKPISRAASTSADRHTERQAQLAELVASWSQRLSAFRSYGVEAAATHPLRDEVVHTSDELSTLRTTSNGAVVLYRSLTIALLIVLVAIAASTDRVDPLGATLALVIVLRALAYSQQFNAARQVAFEALGPAREIARSIHELSVSRRARGTRTLGSFQSVALQEVGISLGQRSILAGVDLKVERGDKIAVVGTSGGGKTTLLELIAGVREPTTGRVTVNGHALKELAPESWSSASAYASQASFLVPGSAQDNVRFLRSDIDVETATTALRAVGLEDGSLETRTEIGTSATALSGGQSQRVGLARALAGTPELLILDEPTSALDLATEAMIVDALERLPSETTVVLISHRPAPLSLCNRFVHVDGGKITELPDRATALDVCAEQPPVSPGRQS